MRLRRTLALLAAVAIVGTGLTLVSSGAASAALSTPRGGPCIGTGTCFAPGPTGAEAAAGTHDVLVDFGEQLLTTQQGIPIGSRFLVTVNGVARTVTVVRVTDDAVADDAVVDLTFSGAVLSSGSTVTVNYRRPLTAAAPQLQDLSGRDVASFVVSTVVP